MADSMTEKDRRALQVPSGGSSRTGKLEPLSPYAGRVVGIASMALIRSEQSYNIQQVLLTLLRIFETRYSTVSS